MANQKYDHLTTMMSEGNFNWMGDRILALLTKGTTFNKANKRLSDVLQPKGTGLQVATSEMPGRVLRTGDDGNYAVGLPAVFNTIGKNVDYQVLLVKDEGNADPAMVAFYDEDQGAAVLRLKNNGTMIVRPVDIPGSDPPEIGVWFQL